MIENHSPGESASNGTYTLNGASKCAKPEPCQKLIHDSDMPYNVLSSIVVLLDDFGINLSVCEFIGEDSQTNPLVTAGLAVGLPSVAIAKGAMKDDRRMFRQFGQEDDRPAAEVSRLCRHCLAGAGRRS